MNGSVHIEIIEEQDWDLFTVDVKTGELKRMTIPEMSWSYTLLTLPIAAKSPLSDG